MLRNNVITFDKRLIFAPYFSNPKTNYFMMKKLFFAVAFLWSIGLVAQNVQLHYDFGENRSYLTSTVEMFKPDKLGNTFFFIDMDYCSGDTKGVSLAYWEIARVMKLEKWPVGLHVEYNGGFGQFKVMDANVAYQINNAYLAGIDYSYNNSDFSKGFTIKALYKHIQDKHDFSFQLTGVWYMHFLDRKLSFLGFVDFWKEDSHFEGNKDAKFIFISEPQIWYNFNKHFSAGGEVELSSNFAGMEGFHAMPTLGLKYSF